MVKADGLASGKGVLICRTKNEVLNFSKKILGAISKLNKISIRRVFERRRVKVISLVVDKNSHKFVGSAQDHKKIGEGETGLNQAAWGNMRQHQF